MSEAANGTAASAVGRAEALLDRLGERVKETGTKIQEVSSPAADASPAATAPTGRPATERAEETLDRAGEQIGVFVTTLSQQVRKFVGLAREEAEDIWAEAQSLRRKDAA